MRIYILTKNFRPIVLVALVLIPLCGASWAQEAVSVPKTGVEEVFLARDDGSGYAGEAVKSFGTDDIPIHCIVQLDSAAPATVKMNFVAVNVQGVKAETRVVSSSYKTKNGEDRVSFTGKPRDKWTAGKYRVDVFVDGKLAKNLEFDIRGPSASVGTSFVESPPASKSRKPKKN